MTIKRMNRKGLSEVVAYVLLIAVAISLSVLVYSWINSYLPKPTNECPDGVSLIIKDYTCEETQNLLNLTVQNKGRFDIEGYILKTSNNTETTPTRTLTYNPGDGTQASSAIVYITSNTELVLSPGQTQNQIFNYSNQNTIKKIQLIPFKLYKGETLLCGIAAITQNIEMCD